MPYTLDRAISGVLVFAKTKPASRSLAAQFERGVPTTHAAVLERGGSRRLVERSSDAAAPHWRKVLARELVGDAVPAHRVMLHLCRIEIAHPTSGERLELSADVPSALRRAKDQRFELPDDAASLSERMRVAEALRHHLDATAYRVVNSGGDELPGVELDRYGEFAVVGLRSERAVAVREAVLDAACELGFRGVYLKIRQKHASVLVDTRNTDFAPRDPVRGEAAPSPLLLTENGVPLLADLGDGLSTGVFLDQRAARKWLRDQPCRSVLNLFAYHGAFTVAAIAGGATQTVTLDASGVALERARENIAHLGVEPSAHELVKADAQRWLHGAAKRGRRFDVVVLDPPSYSTTKRSTFRADRDYPELAAAALRCVAPGGAMLACTNHRGVSPRKLQRMLERAAELADTDVSRMKPLPTPIDFPPEPGEAPHLKRYIVEVEG